MPRRSELKGIVNDLSESLRSRNHDYRGYWCTGQLYKIAKENNTDIIKFEVERKTCIPSISKLQEIINIYENKLFKLTSSKKISELWISSYHVEFMFEQEFDKMIHRWIGIGNPYTLKVTIISDTGRVFSKTVGGYCRPHDPSKERRRKIF